MYVLKDKFRHEKLKNVFEEKSVQIREQRQTKSRCTPPTGTTGKTFMETL